MLTSGWLHVAWSGDPVWLQDSHISHGLHASRSIGPHVGWNDLENGADDSPETARGGIPNPEVFLASTSTAKNA